MPSKETGFRGVSLKTELIEEIERVLEKHVEYRGVPEFISEAVRLRMEQLRKNQRGGA